MPALIPAVTAPAIPPLNTPAAAGSLPAAGTTPQNSFGSVLAQAAGGQSPTGTAAPGAVGVDASGTDPNSGELLDPTRVAAGAAAGLFVVAPGVVLSQAGSAVPGDSIGGPTGGPAGIADPNAPPADAVSRAAEFRLREFVAPQALPQAASARPTTLPTVPAEPVAAEVTDAAATTAPPTAPDPAAAQLPLPTTAGSLPTAGTGLPAGRSPSVVAQVPIVNDLVPPPPGVAAPVAGPAPQPVEATVAPAPLPGVTIGDRPNVAGDRLAADAADGARLAATTPAAPPPAAFAQVLAGATPAEATRAVDASRPTQAATPVAAAVGPVAADIRVSQPAPTAPAASVNPVSPTPGTTSAVPTQPAAPAAVAPPSGVAAPLTPAAVAAPAEAPAPNVARPPAAEPVVADGPRPAAVPAATATPLPVTFAEVFRGRPGVEIEQARATPTDATPDITTAAAFAAPAPAAPPASPAAPTPTTGPAPPAAVQVADGVVAHARTLDRDGTVEFRMRLDPPELGRVYVRLLADGDGVRGQVVVADEAVRQVIESQLPELRQRLEAAGLSVGRFDVSADPGANGRGNPYQNAAAAEPGYEPAAAAKPTAARPAAPARSGRLDVTV